MAITSGWGTTASGGNVALALRDVTLEVTQGNTKVWMGQNFKKSIGWERVSHGLEDFFFNLFNFSLAFYNFLSIFVIFLVIWRKQGGGWQ